MEDGWQETGLCSCLKWGEITLHVLLVFRPRAEIVGRVHPQQKEAQSKARTECGISRKLAELAGSRPWDWSHTEESAF